MKHSNAQSQGIIGISTGSLYKKFSPQSSEAINAIRRTGANAIELCGIRKERFAKNSASSFLNICANELSGFEYVSLHAPCDVVYDDDKQTRELLDTIKELCKKLPIKTVVIHPDRVNSWKIIEEYDLPFAFENMEKPKPRMTTIADLKTIPKKCKIVYDATHAYICDPTMKLGKEVVKEFKDRLAQIHCSGHFVHGKDEQQHFPAVLEEKYWNKSKNLPHQEMFPTIPPNVPVIIESAIPDDCQDPEATLKAELEFIKQKLGENHE